VKTPTLIVIVAGDQRVRYRWRTSSTAPFRATGTPGGTAGL